MLYSDDGKHLILEELDFKRQALDSSGHKRFGGACDLRRIDKELLREDKLVFGSNCLFPPGITTGDGCEFGAFCVFGGDDYFGPNNKFERGCRFMPGCTFGEGCTIDGHKLVGLCPLTIIQMPMIMWPLYFINTEDGILWYSRSSAYSLDEHGVFSDWVRDDCEYMERALTSFVKEAYGKSTEETLQQEGQGDA